MTTHTLSLARPPMALGRIVRRFAYSLRIRRPEFLIAEIPIVLVPALLTAATTAQLRTSVFAEGLLAVYLLFNFGDMVNCLYDRDLDATYKPGLSRAVYGLGVPAVRWQIALTAAAVLLVATHLAWRLDRWLLVPMVIVGLTLGAAYSRPPLRLKGRSIAQLVTLWTIIFTGPMAFVSMLLAPLPPIRVVAVSAAYATLQMGIILLNTAEDFTEDRAAAVRTTVVALGLRRGIALAAALIGVGGGSLVVALAHGALASGGWASVALAALTAVVIAVFAAVLRLRLAMSGDVSRDLPRVRRAAKLVPLALTLVAWTSLAVAYAAIASGGGST